MKVQDIKKVVIVGAGTMGQQIGAQCAIYDLEVVLCDLNHDILDKAFERIEKLLESFIASNKITQIEADAAISRIVGTTNIGEAAVNADLVSESVPEDPDLKGKVFSQFNALCPDHTIFASNTSTLLPSMFAQNTGRPEKLVAIHFHDVRATNIVDVMAHAGTSEETLNVAIEFAIKIGQVPLVLKKESPGYVFNAMLTALFDAAQTLAANAVTSIEEIDRAWMGVLHTPIGPFGLMDSIGIDTVWKAKEYWANKLNDEQNKKNAEFLKRYIDKGHLGQKSGQGFYSYPKPAYRNPGFVKGEVKQLE
jgi:3-hydroxybutyryl-CoA dehydrogenase